MDEDQSISQLAWRVGALETKISELVHSTTESSGELKSMISSLSFVRTDVYAADQKVQAEKDKALAAAVEQARSTAQWAFGLIATGVIGAVITLITTLLK